MDHQPTVVVEQVSKKYCRRLKHSLWYGLRDIAAELTGQDRHGEALRPNEFFALDNVSFELRRGECVGLIGHNGAGKSTLLKMLNGLVRPDKGRIVLRGRVGALIELGVGFSPILSGRENIYINGAVLGFSKREIDAKFDEIVDFAELGDAIDAPVQTYSSGMYVRLGFAVAAQLDPDIFLVDEILAVGDISFRMKCFQFFLDLKKEGKTIVVVSHNMIDINRVCDRVVVLDCAKKIFDGSVPSGIATYESLSVRHGDGTQQRAVNAAAWIDKVRLFDSAGNPCEQFTTGEELVAEVNLVAQSRVTDARLIVHVMTPSLGTLGSFASPHKGFAFDIEPPGLVLRFRMPKLPLLIGSYSLTVSLYGSGIKDFLHAHTHAATFSIVAPAVDTFGYGVCHAINFEHAWELVDFDIEKKSLAS